MADDDEDVAAKLSRVEDKLDSLTARLARQPMTAAQAAAEARQNIARGIAAKAAERETANGGGAA